MTNAIILQAKKGFTLSSDTINVMKNYLAKN